LAPDTSLGELLGRTIRSVAVFGVLILGTGCTTIPVNSPTQYLSTNHPRTLLLTQADHSVVRMSEPHLAGDTVVGMVKGHETAIPLSQLTDLKAVVASPTETEELVAAVGATAALAVWVQRPARRPEFGGCDSTAGPGPYCCAVAARRCEWRPPPTAR
jgi:hypothetical protein